MVFGDILTVCEYQKIKLISNRDGMTVAKSFKRLELYKSARVVSIKPYIEVDKNGSTATPCIVVIVNGEDIENIKGDIRGGKNPHTDTR